MVFGGYSACFCLDGAQAEQEKKQPAIGAGEGDAMSKARDEYYEFKKHADMHYEGLRDQIENYVRELEQDVEEYKRRLSVSNETIDIYEKLVKHVESQRDDLYMELQSNEMSTNELEQEKAELFNALKKICKTLKKHDCRSYNCEACYYDKLIKHTEAQNG